MSKKGWDFALHLAQQDAYDPTPGWSVPEDELVEPPDPTIWAKQHWLLISKDDLANALSMLFPEPTLEALWDYLGGRDVPTLVDALIANFREYGPSEISGDDAADEIEAFLARRSG